MLSSHDMLIIEASKMTLRVNVSQFCNGCNMKQASRAGCCLPKQDKVGILIIRHQRESGLME